MQKIKTGSTAISKRLLERENNPLFGFEVFDQFENDNISEVVFFAFEDVENVA